MPVWPIAFVVALLASALAHAQAAGSVKVTIVGYGIYTAELKIPAVGFGASVQPERVANICHVMTTLVVPTRDNVRFGFRYRVDGANHGASVELKRIVKWPDHTRPADVPVSYLMNEETVKLRIGDQSWAGWRNIRSRPGAWTFQLFHADLRLAEIAFTLVDKSEVTVRPDSDSTCFQMSKIKRGTRWLST